MPERRVVKSSRPVYGRRPQAPRRGRPPINMDALRPLRSLALILLCGFGLWSLFGVRQIEVTGNRTLEPKKIVALAHTSFERHPFSSNLITLGLAPLERELPEGDTRIKEVSVKRIWPSKIVLTVIERQPSLGWRSGSQQFVLDNEGTVIGTQSDLSQKLPTITDSTNLPVKVGDRVVPSRFVVFCIGLIDNMPKRFGLSIAEMKVLDTTSELYVKTGKGYFVKFDTTRPVGEELDDLSGVLDTLTRLNKAPAEYIDVRIAGKAYYK